MHDSLLIPACFSPAVAEKCESLGTAINKPGQCIFISVYRAKLAGCCRLITITWRKNLLLHVLSLSVQSISGLEEDFLCKIELKPWSWGKKYGSTQFSIDGKAVDVVWDLQAAKFLGEAEPRSDYYVALACDQEAVLVVGDLKKDAYRKTRCRPALIDPMLVSRTEHVFGKKQFITRFKFHDREKIQEISIRFITGSSNANYFSRSDSDPQLEIKVEGQLAVQVQHLQWKFRGNECFHVCGRRKVEICWDVHGWLFNTGPRYGLFMFKPVSSLSRLAPLSPSSSFSIQSEEQMNFITTLDNEENDGPSNFCLFVYAWMLD